MCHGTDEGRRQLECAGGRRERGQEEPTKNGGRQRGSSIPKQNKSPTSSGVIGYSSNAMLVIPKCISPAIFPLEVSYSDLNGKPSMVSPDIGRIG
jgi:hypothetical protein